LVGDVLKIMNGLVKPLHHCNDYNLMSWLKSNMTKIMENLREKLLDLFRHSTHDQ
jgi:hypothetical protein